MSSNPPPARSSIEPGIASFDEVVAQLSLHEPRTAIIATRDTPEMLDVTMRISFTDRMRSHFYDRRSVADDEMPLPQITHYDVGRRANPDSLPYVSRFQSDGDDLGCGCERCSGTYGWGPGNLLQVRLASTGAPLMWPDPVAASHPQTQRASPNAALRQAQQEQLAATGRDRSGGRSLSDYQLGLERLGTQISNLGYGNNAHFSPAAAPVEGPSIFDSPSPPIRSEIALAENTPLMPNAAVRQRKKSVAFANPLTHSPELQCLLDLETRFRREIAPDCNQLLNHIPRRSVDGATRKKAQGLARKIEDYYLGVLDTMSMSGDGEVKVDDQGEKQDFRTKKKELSRWFLEVTEWLDAV